MLLVISNLLFLSCLGTCISVDINSQCVVTYYFTNSTPKLASCQAYDLLNPYNYTSWEDCSHFCCGWPTQSPNFSLQAIQKCINNTANNKKAFSLIYVIIAIIAMLGFLAIAYIIYKILLKTRQNRVSSSDKLGERVVRGLKWQSTQCEYNLQTGNSLIDKQDNCAICLERRPNTQLTCLHWFHFRCFLHWALKSKVCPLCRANNIGHLTLYCQQCRRRFTIISFQSLALLFYSNWISKCDNCQRINQTATSIDQSFQILKKKEVSLDNEC